MDSTPIVFVAGLGRCGSSLVMQMLHAAGLPCVGMPPGYEDNTMTEVAGPPSPEWLADRAGNAIKWLDPHRLPVPEGTDAVCLFLIRDKREQARSQAKFAATFLQQPMPNRKTIRRWAGELGRSERKAWRAASRFSAAIVGFEELLAEPAAVSIKIARFLAPFYPQIDAFATPPRMARCVIPRGPECQEGLDIEMRLVEEAQANGA